MISNIAAYKFVDLPAPELLREELHARCAELALKGTILLSSEGINLFLAGNVASVEALIACLRAKPEFSDLEVKHSRSRRVPFRRLLVKVKREIIPLGDARVRPARQRAPAVSPQQLKQWLDQGEEVVLLDTRNSFEVQLGTFRQAHELGLKHFREFAQAAAQLDPSLKDKRVVTFCTGGIRCEKAAPLLLANGFKQVLQLDGGILRYFEECGAAHFDGNCFVFDEREALTPQLEPLRD